MKYLVIPIYRLLLMLFVAFYQCFLLLIYILLLIWNLSPPKVSKKDFYYPLEDGYRYLRTISTDCPPREYYKNPWDALFKNITYLPNKEV